MYRRTNNGSGVAGRTVATTFLVAASLSCSETSNDAAGSGSSGGTTTTSASESNVTGQGTIASEESTVGADSTDAAEPGSSSSSSETTAAETSAPVCADLGDPCTVCENAACPDEYCGCLDNTDCILMAQCTAGCAIDDPVCNQGCWSQYPDGISDGALLTHCAAVDCPAECGPYVPLTRCQECLYRDCPAEMNVCVANPDCTALLECLAACGAPGCESSCYTAHPDGLADSGPVGKCGQDACTTECA